MAAFEFTTPIEVRFADLDAYGHVNNAVFFTFLESARIKFFQQHFGEFLDHRLMFLVVRAECDYRLPIELNNPVQVTVAVDRVRHSSFDFSYRVHDGADRLFAEAKTVMVCYDPHGKRPVAIPAAIKRLFKGVE